MLKALVLQRISQKLTSINLLKIKNLLTISLPERFAAVLTGEGETLHVSLYVILYVGQFFNPSLSTQGACKCPVSISDGVLQYFVFDHLQIHGVLRGNVNNVGL